MKRIFEKETEVFPWKRNFKNYSFHKINVTTSMEKFFITTHRDYSRLFYVRIPAKILNLGLSFNNWILKKLSIFSFFAKNFDEFYSRITWFIDSLIIVSPVTFFLWLATWFSITLHFWVFLFISFCLNRLTTRVFPLERQTFLLYAKVIIKTKRTRQGKTQIPHGDTELRKAGTQS